MKKITRSKLLLPLAASALAVVPIATLAASAGTVSKRVLFNNKIFSDYEAAVEYYLSQNTSKISKIQVLGDIGSAVLDLGTGRLNPNLLPEYDPAQIAPAYRTANNTLTSSKDEALASYANPGLANLMYSFPGAKSAYIDEESAREAANKTVFSETMYTVDLLRPGSTTEKITINPTNGEDIKNLKAEVWNYFKNQAPMAGVPEKGYTNPGWSRTYVYERGDGAGYGKAVANNSLPNNIKKLSLNELAKQFTAFLTNKLAIETNNFATSKGFNYQYDAVPKSEQADYAKRSRVIYSNNQVTVRMPEKNAFYYDENDQDTRGFGTFKIKFNTDIKNFNSSLANAEVSTGGGTDYRSVANGVNWFTDVSYRFFKPDDVNTTYAFYQYAEARRDPHDENIYYDTRVKKTGTNLYKPIALSSINDVRSLRLDADKQWDEEPGGGKHNTSGGKPQIIENTLPPMFYIPNEWKTSNLTANKKTIFSDYDSSQNVKFFQNINIDFNDSWIHHVQNLYGSGTQYIHYLKILEINNVNVVLRLKSDEVISRYFDEFIKTVQTDSKVNPFQLGYYYNDKLMFTQSLYDPSQVDQITPVSAQSLINVSLVSEKSLTETDEQLKVIWSATSGFDLVKALKNLDKLKPIADTEVKYTVNEDPIRQIFTYARKFEDEFLATPETERDERFVAKIKYDATQKWLSFGRNGFADAAQAVKVFNIYVGNNLNPSLTSLVNNLISTNGVTQSLIAAKDYATVEAAIRKAAPKVAKVWVFYNLLGKQILVSSKNPYDSSMFDNIDLMRENIVSKESATQHGQDWGIIDNTHVFVGGKLVTNKLSDIYRFEQKTDVVHYFGSSENLRAFVLQLVKADSILLV